MKADLYIKLSKYVLLALLAVTFVLLGLFFFVGFGNEVILPGQEKPLKDPQFLSALMYWMYILVIVPVLLIFVYQSVGFFKKLVSNPKEAMKGLVGPVLAVVLTVAAFVIAYTSDSNSAEAIQNGLVAPILINNAVCMDETAMILTDALLYIQYVLFFISAIATFVSLIGVFKYVNKVK
ncbi:MAG: hypothetical protein J6U62_01760 [Bacteroidaceae bacterium]|nr:hypothetical protein [Bacteroidaceae bacterium]